MNIPKLNLTKKTVAYMYLYTAYTGIFAYFAYSIKYACRPLGMLLVIFYTIICFLIYIIINHLLIRYVISTKILILFETVLLLTLFALFICYAFLWNR